ncbi:MAG TPA: ABC transporter permease [Longimicrobiales bacterium]
MSRIWSVVKREFNEMVRTKAFVIGTVLVPVFMIGIFALQIVFLRSGGGERSVAIVAEGDEALARAVAAALAAAPGGSDDAERTRFQVEVVPAGDAPDAVRAALVERVRAEELDGYLWLPAGVIDGAKPLYEGRNATNFDEMGRVEAAVQQAVQAVRLRNAGIDPAQVAAALARVELEAHKIGGRAASGTPAALVVLTYVVGFAVYLAVIMYGTAIARSVLEEKRDRIVEVVISSIRAEQLLAGKVVGIGAAGVFQLLIWIAFGALVQMRGGAIAARFGATMPELPDIPLSVVAVFVFFFLAGFFLYAGLFAAMGAMATTDQEAQQLQFPVILPLLVAFLMMSSVLQDPDAAVAVAGSLIPLTSPVVMPMRAVIGEVPAVQLAGSAALSLGTTLAILWLSARIYRIGILATGKRPSAKEVWRWLRTS